MLESSFRVQEHIVTTELCVVNGCEDRLGCRITKMRRELQNAAKRADENKPNSTGHVTLHKAIPSVCSARAQVPGMLCGNESSSSFIHYKPEVTLAMWTWYVYSGPVTFAWVSFKIHVLVQNVVRRLWSANFLVYKIVSRGWTVRMYCCDTAVGLCPFSDKMQHFASYVSDTAVSPSTHKKGR